MTTSPTFVAEFEDKQTTRMSIRTPLEKGKLKLDLARAVSLACHAHRSRVKHDRVVQIARAHFEDCEGHLLQKYDKGQLTGHVNVHHDMDWRYDDVDSGAKQGASGVGEAGNTASPLETERRGPNSSAGGAGGRGSEVRGAAKVKTGRGGAGSRRR